MPTSPATCPPALPCLGTGAPTPPGGAVPVVPAPGAATGTATGAAMPTVATPGARDPVPAQTATPGGTATGPVVMPPVTSPVTSLPPTTPVPTTPVATTPVATTPVVSTPAPAVTPVSGGAGGGLSPVVVVGLVAGLLVALALLGVARWGGRQRPRRLAEAGATSSVTYSGTSSSPAAPGGGHVASDHDVDALIHAFDLAASDAERASVEERLAELGVHRVGVLPGEPVDPARHNVVGLTHDGDGTLAGTVSDVVRPGWADEHRVIRVVDVRAHAPTGART